MQAVSGVPIMADGGTESRAGFNVSRHVGWLLLAALAFVLTPSAARAWGQSGHYTICEIAYSNLTPAARAEVDRLIAVGGGYATFSHSCIFPDSERLRTPEHYVSYARADERVTGPGCPGNRPCLITAITNDLEILRSGTASDADKSTALKFIGHWIADIHQPLDISFADDWGGSQIDISGGCLNSLHSVWDTCIIERRVFAPGPDRHTRAVAAAARLNAAITPSQRHAWRGSEPWEWAAESFEIATRPETGYCVRRAGSCWYSATAETYEAGTPRRIQIVDENYLEWATPIVEDRLERAGIRLAHALNETFDPSYIPDGASPGAQASPGRP